MLVGIGSVAIVLTQSLSAPSRLEPTRETTLVFILCSSVFIAYTCHHSVILFIKHLVDAPCPIFMQTFMRRLVPRRYRTEIDLVIRDLTLDIREMREEGQPWWLIGIVKAWHTLTTIYGLLCDLVYSALRRVTPSVDRYSKISSALNLINRDDNEGQE